MGRRDRSPEGLTTLPDLHRTRGDVLAFLLTSNGNGYRWNSAGEIEAVGPADDDDNPFWAADEATMQARQAWASGRTDRATTLRVEDDLTSACNIRDDLATVLDGVEDRAQRMTLTPLDASDRRYDGTVGLLATAPANVTADWALAIEQTRAMMAADAAAAEAARQAARSTEDDAISALTASLDATALAALIADLPHGRDLLLAVATRQGILAS